MLVKAKDRELAQAQQQLRQQVYITLWKTRADTDHWYIDYVGAHAQCGCTWSVGVCVCVSFSQMR